MARKSSKAPEQIAQPARFDNQLPKLDVAGSSPVARSLADSTAAFLPPQEAYAGAGGQSTSPIFSVPNPRAGCIVTHAPAAAYHKWPQISASNLKDFEASPWIYYQREITGEAAPKTGEALTHGTLVHDLHEALDIPSCDPSAFFATVEIAPSEFETATGNLSKKGEEWLKSLPPGMRGMTQATADKIRRAFDQMMLNPAVGDLFSHRVDAEFCVVGKINGHDCRCRSDGATEWCWYDLKTTSDARPLETFHSSVRQYKYDLQAAFYEALAEQAGWPPFSLHFVITQTVYPFHAHVVTLPRAVTDRARQRVDRLLDDLAQRREWGSWLPSDYGSVTELVCPQFMKGGDDGGEW